MYAEVPMSNGPTSNKKAVSLQFTITPTTIPDTNVATYCDTMLNLLPIPSRIRSTSL